MNVIMCKICGQHHSGRICTKFSGVRVLPARANTPKLLAAPKKAKAKAAK